MAEFDFSVPRHSDTTFVDVDLVEETLEGVELRHAVITGDQAVVIALTLGMDVREA